MKRLIIPILCLLFLFGCNNIDYKPKYKDFNNDWERENLIGKVRSFEYYKAIVSDFELDETDKPSIVLRKDFTEKGNILKEEYYDQFGTLEQYVKNKFDEYGYPIEKISENYLMPTKFIEELRFDTIIDKQISSHIIFNDTLIYDVTFEYDDCGNLIRQSNAQNDELAFDVFEYKYDNNCNIIFKKQIDNSEASRNDMINEFSYDGKGNLIEVSSKSKVFGEMRILYDYDSDNRRTKMQDYRSGEIQKETIFDKYNNKTLERIYVSNALHKEIKYRYSFDKNGNWNEREVFMKENFGDKKTVHIYTETRKIEYY